jgi:hypothetical protein
MKLNYRDKVRLTAMFLCLMALLTACIGNVSAYPQSDRQREIVSEDFTKNRRRAAGAGSKSQGRAARSKRRLSYRLASTPTAKSKTPSNASFIAQLGITIWRLRLASPSDVGRALLREKDKSLSWVPERVESDATFREGDFVRISVESPYARYLYVVDRDLFADGTTGSAMLIYPWSDVSNRLFPGRLIDIPAQEDTPSYFTARLTSAGQVGELLTFIVTSTPLKLPISHKPLQIAADQMREWEKIWTSVSERFELEGGAGEAWTPAEQQAAAREGARQLTRDDPRPQTICRVAMPNAKAFLVNLRLKYGK